MFVPREDALARNQRSMSVMSNSSVQDSQLQFYDAIEYFTSDTDSDSDTEQESDVDGGDDKSIISSTKSPTMTAIVPGTFILNYIVFNGLSL